MIEVYELTKRFGSTVAVDEVTFEVHPGRVTGFLGPNGAGKSTTMRVLLGLDAPTRGEALLNDRPYPSFRRPLREVGALLDAGAVHGGRSAYDHLLCIAQSNDIPRGRVADVLAQVGLEDVARKRIGDFSLGMKQRLGIAAALLGDPGILMFDEPINGLDPEGIHWIRGLLRSLAADGRTVFLSSHLMSEMALTADHLIVVGRGRLVADTSVQELMRSGSGGDVLVRTAQGPALAGVLTGHGAGVTHLPDGGLAVIRLDAKAVGDLAAAHGIPVHELTPRLPSLEEVFMQLTDDSVEYRTNAAEVRS